MYKTTNSFNKMHLSRKWWQEYYKMATRIQYSSSNNSNNNNRFLSCIRSYTVTTVNSNNNNNSNSSSIRNIISHNNLSNTLGVWMTFDSISHNNQTKHITTLLRSQLELQQTHSITLNRILLNSINTHSNSNNNCNKSHWDMQGHCKHICLSLKNNRTTTTTTSTLHQKCGTFIHRTIETCV